MESKENAASCMEMLGFSDALVTPFVLRAVISLGIPNILASKPKDDQEECQSLHYNEIAATINKNNLAGKKLKARHHAPCADVVRRLLQCLCRKGIFHEDPAGFFTHTRLSKTLITENNPHSIAPLIMLQTSKPMQSALQQLDRMALEQEYDDDQEHNRVSSPFAKANGGKNLFELAATDPAFGKIFSAALEPPFNAMFSMIIPCVLDNYDGFKSLEGKVLVDVGGNKGFCLSKIVQAYPNLRGINYDLPHVVANAPQISGVEHIGGSMFNSVPAGDAIFMKTVLHNWSDDQCRIILKNCFKALPENGKLIIVDMIYNPGDKNIVVDNDIMMLVVTGGKERSESEWTDLLVSQGFTGIKFKRLPTSKEGIIEAHKSS